MQKNPLSKAIGIKTTKTTDRTQPLNKYSNELSIAGEPGPRTVNIRFWRESKQTQHNLSLGYVRDLDYETQINKLSTYLYDRKSFEQPNAEHIIRCVKHIITKRGITEPTNDNAVELKRQLRLGGCQPNTIRIYMWAMRYWARSQLKDIDFDYVELPDIEIHEIKIVDAAVIRKLLKDGSITTRERCIIALLAHTGVRVGELCRIQLEHISLKEGIIELPKTKNKKSRYVPVSDEALDLLKRWIGERASVAVQYKIQHTFLFIAGNGEPLGVDGVRKMMYRLKKSRGIKGKFHPHLLRHTAATMMLRTPGANIREVQQILGHSSVTITERYTHNDDAQVLRQKFKGLTY